MKQEDVKRLAIFDMDGTLIQTPLKEDGVKIYEKVKQQDWPHKGWWSKPESLDMELYDMPTVYETIYAYNQEKKDPDTVVIMMTGRRDKLAEQVKKILDHHNLEFDEYIYNTGGDTLGNKLNYLDKLIKKYPNVESVHMWEDRVEHVRAFKAWGDRQTINFDITIIKSGHHD